MARVSIDVNSHVEEERAKGVKKLINAAEFGMAASTARTPFKGGELRARRSVRKLPNGARMAWSDGVVSIVQNQGWRRGARPFTNYTTPGTGAGFVELAVTAARDKLKATL